MFINVTLLCGAVAATPLPEDAVICYAASDAFVSLAPSGWMVDREAGAERGVCAFYVLEGSTFDTSPVVIYPTADDETEHRLPSGQVDIAGYIARDIAKFQAIGANLAVTSRPAIKTRSKLTFQVRQFNNGPPPNEFELVGYLAGDSAILSVVYSARRKEDFERFVPAFEKVIQGIRKVPVKVVYSSLRKMAAEEAKRPESEGFEQAFSAAIAQKTGETVRACVKADTRAIHAVFQLSPQGSIDEVTLEEDSEVGRCFKQGMQGTVGSRPPFAPYHLGFDLRVEPGSQPASAKPNTP